MAKRRRRRSRNSRRRRIRNAIRITLFLLIVAAIIAGIALLVSKLINKGGEPADIGDNTAIEQPVGQEQEEKQGFFARLFKKKDKEQGSLFDEEGNPVATQPPEPTPTPLPEFSPYSVAGTSPSDFGLETKIEVDGSGGPAALVRGEAGRSGGL